jgi:shikimate dehydrogenase
MSENSSIQISLGLLGRNIQHSQSPKIYKRFLGNDLSYKLFDFSHESEIPEIESIFKEVLGLSITAPYKTHFIKKIELDEISQKLGAINCIRKTADNKFQGTLTDYPAFCEIYDSMLEPLRQGPVIIMGSGSMAKMVELILDKRNIPYNSFSRSNHQLQPFIDFSTFNSNLVVNCCAREYVFDGTLAKNTTFYDFNYSHTHRQVLSLKEGIRYIDGEELLILQAKYALIYWGIKL